MNYPLTPGEIERMNEIKYTERDIRLERQMESQAVSLRNVEKVLETFVDRHEKVHEAILKKDIDRDKKIARNTSYINKIIGAVATIIGIPTFLYGIIKLKVFGG